MKRLKQIVLGLGMAAAIAAAPVPVYAMEDGAYTVGRTTSYANPETGQTVDGGTNIALGDSMCESIVEDSALVEQSQGKTYVTLGIGLMSNVSDVRMQIQGTDGTYRDVEITQTGSCERDGDTCNHYRFEVDSADNYISPILYVEPMGRDVQFFVKLDMASAQAGTGNFG
ncbi:MAG: heme-binding Shp domain-containing protein [[Clostridium] nexile]